MSSIAILGQSLNELDWPWRGKSFYLRGVVCVFRSSCWLAVCMASATSPAGEQATKVFSDATLGERLFFETRFAHGGDVSVSCATCHVQAAGSSGFSAHNLVPIRGDIQRETPRNAQSLPAALESNSVGWNLLHWDGEFARPEDLVRETFFGRNFGWLPQERAQALRHFARVIRGDDGQDVLVTHTDQLSYAVLLRGEDPRIPDALRLPSELRVDPAKASDEDIVEGCAHLLVNYLRSLGFSRDENGWYNGSPYDAFLAVNRLPRAPAPNETPHEYARRLHNAIAALRSPQFIDKPSRRLQVHDQPFRFGELELRGMKMFFRGTLGYGRAAGSGNCAECHVPPAFTDGAFHNTGASQDAYDTTHGTGAFVRLIVPGVAERNRDFDQWLPPTPHHPQAQGRYRSSGDGKSSQPDLGLWNVYANPDLPAPQSVIERKLNPEGRLKPDEVLALTLGRFKTPTLRNLGQSAPYLHNGAQRSLEDVLKFYQRMSDLAQDGAMRNAPPEYATMKLEDADLASLAAFLRSLNEDYVPPSTSASK